MFFSIMFDVDQVEYDQSLEDSDYVLLIFLNIFRNFGKF